jgi:hypothetical protein
MSVLPLFLKERNLGFLVVQARDCKSAVLEAIREHVSIALYGAWLASRDSNS